MQCCLLIGRTSRFVFLKLFCSVAQMKLFLLHITRYQSGLYKVFVDLCLNLFSSECCYKCEEKKVNLGEGGLWNPWHWCQQIKLVPPNRFSSFFSTLFACSITVFSCHLYDDRQKYGEYSVTSLPEHLKSHYICVNHFHKSCSGQLLG